MDRNAWCGQLHRPGLPTIPTLGSTLFFTSTFLPKNRGQVLMYPPRSSTAPLLIPHFFQALVRVPEDAEVFLFRLRFLEDVSPIEHTLRFIGNIAK